MAVEVVPAGMKPVEVVAPVGGAIYLKGDNVIINAGVKISASGGLPALENRGIIASGNTDASDGGGAGAACGGGGRVYLEATSSLVNNGSSTNGNLLAAEEPVLVVRERMVRSRLSDHRLQPGLYLR